MPTPNGGEEGVPFDPFPRPPVPNMSAKVQVLLSPRASDRRRSYAGSEVLNVTDTPLCSLSKIARNL